VRIRTRPQRDSMIDDMLGDPFMQNFFGATVTKDITATSAPSDLTVLELPVEGRPPSFSGAVGSFKIAGDISSNTAAAGDPLTLRMHVTGTGNFDRVDSAMLEHLDRWKTYPPKSSFKASDALGLKGEKIFEQPLIASQPGTRTLPGLAFSYFDPGTHRYETAHSAPLNVTISPSLADGSLNAPPLPAGGAPSARPAATASSNPGLRPDHVATEGGISTLVPPYLQPRFLAIPSLLALTFAGGWLGLRRRVSDSSNARAGRKRALKDIDRVLNDLEAAARAGDAASFFTRARTALEAQSRTVLEAQSRAALKAGRSTQREAASGVENAESRTALAAGRSIQLEAASGGENTESRTALEAGRSTQLEGGTGVENDDIHRFLALADEVNYAGLRPTHAEFERWIRFIRDALHRDTLERDTLERAVRQRDELPGWKSS